GEARCHTNVTVKALTGGIGVRQFRRMTKLHKTLILGLAIALGMNASASAQMLINGAGATFPYPIYSKWFDEYAKVDPSVRFNYQSIGSGGGQKQILAQTVDFGASDGPMSDENLGKAPGKILHIPTVAGAVVLTYNLAGNPSLKLDGESGQVKQTPRAIGYVELIYAIQNKMPYAEVKNSAGQFMKATIDSLTAALATAEIPDDFRFSMTNAPGKHAYPIRGATWLLV